MHASTWHGTPAEAASAAISPTGSRHAVRVGRRADHHQRRPLVERCRRRRPASARQVDRVDRDVDDVEVEQVRGLAEGGVRGDREQQPRSPGAAPRAPGLPRRQHGEQAALGAPAGERAHRLRSATEQRGRRRRPGRSRAGPRWGRPSGPARSSTGTPPARPPRAPRGRRGRSRRRRPSWRRRAWAVAGLQRGELGQHLVGAHAVLSGIRGSEGRRRTRGSVTSTSSAGTTLKPTRTAVTADAGCRTTSSPVEDA